MRADTPLRTLVALQFRLSRRGALAWGAAMAAALAAGAAAWSTAYPTHAARAMLARTIGSTAAFRAIAGPPIALDTIGGFIAWRLGIFGVMLLGVWGLLTTTRLLRADEDSGRWDIVLSAPVTARSATTATLVAVGIDIACLWAIVIGTLLVLGPKYGMPAGGSLAFSSALALGAGAFAAVGALVAQLAAPRRMAAGIAGSTVAVAMLVRVAADASSASWLRWLSPLGWMSEVRAFGGARPAVLLLYVAFISVCAAIAIQLAGRRDAGAGMLPSRDRVVGRTRAFRTPELAALRFSFGPAAAWTAGAVAFSLLIGSIAPSVQKVLGNSGIEKLVQGLGSFASVRAYLSFAQFGVLTFVASLIAAGSASSQWDEERSARADTVLSSGIGRRRWLGGRIAVAAATTTVVVLAASIATWGAIAAVSGGVPFATLLGAGLGMLPVAAVFLGVGVAVYGLVPRGTAGAAYGAVVASFLLEIIGAVSRWPHWLLDLSPFHHAPGAPLQPVDLKTSAALLAVAAAGVVVGLEAFARRDVRIA